MASGTASSKKFLKNVSGLLTEEAAMKTSGGVDDAGKLPALNDSGILDDTILNASATTGANKIAKMNGSGILDPGILNATASSVGESDAAKIVKLDGSGRIDSTMMPVGMGPDTAIINATEALAAGDFVNVYNSSGAKCRKADATSSGKEAHGFVLSSVNKDANATVYFEGTNTGVTGMTPGVVFLSATAGLATGTAPSSAGNVVQRLGVAVSATAINFESGPPVILA